MLSLSFRQQVLAGFVFSIILVFFVGFLSYTSIHQLEDDTRMVDHTQQVIKHSNNLLQYMVDAETGMRGYGATNNKVFLDPYNAAIPKVSQDLNELKNLISDNPAQIQRVDTLYKLVDNQLNILKTNIITRQDKGLEYMVQNQMFLQGKHTMDSIRNLSSSIIAEENHLLQLRKQSSQEASANAMKVIIIGSIAFLFIILVLFFYIQRTFSQQKKIEAEILKTNDELENVLEENEGKNWLLTGTAKLNEEVQGEQGEKGLSKNIIAEICKYTGAQVGTFYLYDDKEDRLEFMAGYAFDNVDQIKKFVKPGEGWVGQVMDEKAPKLVKGKINNSLSLDSSILKHDLTETYIVPYYFERKLKGVFEIGFQDGLDARRKLYLETVATIVGVSINTAQARTLMHDLFEEVQQQAEELEAQQEEMRVTNEELIKKTEMLQASEEELRVQQEELRTTNAELEEKAALLEEKNQAIEDARGAIAQKMAELETTGKYKSEFLANMSHELRTPLNSILVLARILKDNKPGTLSDDQIKYASVIFNAGNDLLTLINDILDLSKIESGKLDLQIENVKIDEILMDVEMLFAEVARNKNITYTTVKADNLPQHILTDQVRSEQVIKNLLSNAFKFTSEHGSVTINAGLDVTGKNLTIGIKDTGIGIAYDKQKLIFEAFQQADGSTSRKYGGTGLGLSISRELAGLLGGYIKLESTPGQGSEFTLVLPLEGVKVNREEEQLPNVDDLIAKTQVKTFDAAQSMKIETVQKGRSEALVLIVEDDKNFSGILQDYAKQHGYKSIVAYEGTNVFNIVKENLPDAIILDIMLPGKDGWQIIKELKSDPATASIPVHLMSAGDTATNTAKKAGAINFFKKPINADLLDKLFQDMASKAGGALKNVLLIEDHQMQSFALKELMEKQGITVDQAFDGASAFEMVNANDYQCVILDLNLPDISGLDLLDKIKEIERFAELPVIINTAMELDKASVNRLMQYANAMVVKSNKSSERLIDEVNLFLNKINSMSQHPYQGNADKGKSITGDKSMLKNKKILVVDDDMRNIFALTSALESYDFKIEVAYDGQEALDKLNTVTDIDMVLMDIMMPVMDGYEATRQIRKNNKWAKLPVIALTAKAMKDDREKCIAAGANDYITKPVDIDRLIALMQIWLEQ
jgi:CheY-like chemotaxis protein/CHASE3 domain sensor protein